jgi:hypothetical protein
MKGCLAASYHRLHTVHPRREYDRLLCLPCNHLFHLSSHPHPPPLLPSRPANPTVIPSQYARKFRDAEAPRPWSKYSEGSSRHAKLAPPPEGGATAVDADAADGAGEGRRGKDGKDGGKKKPGGRKGAADGAAAAPEEADEKLSEFLALMQPRSKARVWSNDEVLPGGVLPAGEGRAGGGGGSVFVKGQKRLCGASMTHPPALTRPTVS